MKRFVFLIIILLPLVCNISAGQNQIPDSVKREAMARTDRQIDSVYSITPADIDALKSGFQTIRNKMDTINAEAIIRVNDFERRRAKSDSVLRNWIVKALEAQAEKEKAEVTIKSMLKIQDYIFLFFVVVAAVQFSIGINRYFTKPKKND